MATYVLVDAADDYRVVFSLAELDSGFQDSEVCWRTRWMARRLPAGQGPFKLVAPHEKRPARWVDMVRSITVGRESARLTCRSTGFSLRAFDRLHANRKTTQAEACPLTYSFLNTLPSFITNDTFRTA